MLKTKTVQTRDKDLFWELGSAATRCTNWRLDLGQGKSVER